MGGEVEGGEEGVGWEGQGREVAIAVRDSLYRSGICREEATLNVMECDL
jgi:hypothetical protein